MHFVVVGVGFVVMFLLCHLILCLLLYVLLLFQLFLFLSVHQASVGVFVSRVHSCLLRGRVSFVYVLFYYFIFYFCNASVTVSVSVSVHFVCL